MLKDFGKSIGPKSCSKNSIKKILKYTKSIQN